jgi:hypothetical protein
MHASHRSAKHTWEVRVVNGGKATYVGCFEDEVEAARAYDRVAVELKGAKARLNFPTQAQKDEGSTRYKGVSRLKAGSGRWRAVICDGPRSRHIGCFQDPIEAARAYDRAALELKGAAAELNFPVEVQVGGGGCGGASASQGATGLRDRVDAEEQVGEEDVGEEEEEVEGGGEEEQKENEEKEEEEDHGETQTRVFTSQYRGVSWNKLGRNWKAQMYRDGKQCHLGCFSVEKDAAEFYDAAAMELFGH